MQHQRTGQGGRPTVGGSSSRTHAGWGREPYSEPEACHDLGQMDVVCPACGALHWHLERVARSSTAERSSFSLCCKQGQVRLAAQRDPPDTLRYFFSSMDPVCRDFREHIRQYNAAFAFTSLGVQVDDTVNGSSRGPPVVRIHGEVCHRVGSLLPVEGQRPVYSQLYIYDPHDALEHRTSRNENLRESTLASIQTVVNSSHAFT